MADAILGDLQEARRLKDEGAGHAKKGEWRLAYSKYQSALARLEGYAIGQAGRVCPSQDPEYQAVWTGVLEQHAELELACHLNVALCRLKCEEWAEAVEAASCALRLVPRHAKALFRRGVGNFRRSTAPGAQVSWLAEAKDDLAAAATIEPQNREIRLELQAVKEALKAEREEAAAKAAEARAAAGASAQTSVGSKGSGWGLYEDADDGPLPRMHRLMEEAAALRAEGKADQALSKFSSAMRDAVLAGADAGAKITVQLGAGDCCMDLQNYERALTQFEVAAELAAAEGDRQVEARAWASAGVAMYLEGKVAESITPYQRCLEAATACGDAEMEQLAREGIDQASDPALKAKSLENIMSKLST